MSEHAPLKIKIVRADTSPENTPASSQTEYPLLPDQILIGSLTISNIPLNDPEVSRRHALIYRDEDAYFIEDLRSTNGTRLNGDPIEPDKPKVLKPGDRIGIGSFELLVLADTDDDTTVSLPTTERPAPPLTTKEKTIRVLEEWLNPAPDPAVTPYIEVSRDGGGAEKDRWFLDTPGKQWTIGRHESNDFVLPFPQVSRRHATIRLTENNLIYIRDDESANGTMLDQRRLRRETRWSPDQTVTIGGFTLTLHLPQNQPLEQHDHHEIDSPEKPEAISAQTDRNSAAPSPWLLIGLGAVICLAALGALIYVLTA